MANVDNGKFKNIINRPEFSRYFSYSTYDAVCQLTDENESINKSDMLKLIRFCRYSDVAMPLAIAHKDFTIDVQNELVEQQWFTPELALELAKREDVTDYNANTILLNVNIDLLYSKLWENRGNTSPISQIVLRHIAADYLTGNRKLFADEFAVIFAHIKDEKLIERVLDNMDSYPWLTSETRERMNACIASNININEDLRMRAFLSDCDIGMVQAKTPTMNHIMYESLVEAYAEVDDDSPVFSTKMGAYNRLMLMLQEGQLSEDCEMDLYNRARSITNPALKANEIINTILSLTKNPALLQCREAENPRELMSIAKNPNISTEERLFYLLKSMEKIRPYHNRYKTVSKDHLSNVKEYLQHKPLPQNMEEILIGLKDRRMNNIMAASYNTSEKINRMLQAQASQETCSVAIITNIAQKLGITEKRKDELVALLESVHKFNDTPIGRDDDCTLYVGPKGISDYDMLTYEEIFEYLTRSHKSKIKKWGEICIDALRCRKEIEEKNKKFDLKKNTNAHLALMKYNMIINLNKTDEISMYKKIAKVSDLCQKIDDEIIERKKMERGEIDERRI